MSVVHIKTRVVSPMSRIAIPCVDATLALLEFRKNTRQDKSSRWTERKKKWEFQNWARALSHCLFRAAGGWQSPMLFRRSHFNYSPLLIRNSSRSIAFITRKSGRRKKKTSVEHEASEFQTFSELGKWRMRRCIVATTNKITERQTDTILINDHCIFGTPTAGRTEFFVLHGFVLLSQPTMEFHKKGVNFSFPQNTHILYGYHRYLHITKGHAPDEKTQFKWKIENYCASLRGTQPPCQSQRFESRKKRDQRPRSTKSHIDATKYHSMASPFTIRNLVLQSIRNERSCFDTTPTLHSGKKHNIINQLISWKAHAWNIRSGCSRKKFNKFECML